jgi:hypothetical protein
MLFRETVAVYCESHTEHTDKLCRQNARFYSVKAGGIYFKYLNYLMFLKFVIWDKDNYSI